MIEININTCNIQNMNNNISCNEKNCEDGDIVFIRVINSLDTQAVLFDLMPIKDGSNENIRIFAFDGTMPVPMWKVTYYESNMVTIKVPDMNLYWTYPVDSSDNRIILAPLKTKGNNRQFFIKEPIPNTDFITLRNDNSVFVSTTQNPVQPNTDLIAPIDMTFGFKAGLRFDQPN